MQLAPADWHRAAPARRTNCLPYPAGHDWLWLVNVNLGIWNKLNGLAVFLCFVAIILFVGAWYLPLIQQNERMRRRILEQDSQIQKQEDASRQLRAAIDALRYNPKAVERLAREKFGYAKPGETVIRFGPPQPESLSQR